MLLNKKQKKETKRDEKRRKETRGRLFLIKKLTTKKLRADVIDFLRSNETKRSSTLVLRDAQACFVCTNSKEKI